MPNVHNGSTRIYWRGDGDPSLPSAHIPVTEMPQAYHQAVVQDFLKT